MDTEKQRQHRRDDARLTESGNARSKQLLVVPTESLTNRVWIEWVRTSKAQLVFRCEISDLFNTDSNCHQNCHCEAGSEANSLNTFVWSLNTFIWTLASLHATCIATCTLYVCVYEEELYMRSFFVIIHYCHVAQSHEWRQRETFVSVPRTQMRLST